MSNSNMKRMPGGPMKGGPMGHGHGRAAMGERGTHEELLKNCEVYKQIALSQLSKEELGDE